MWRNKDFFFIGLQLRHTCLMALAHSAHAQLNRNLHMPYNPAQWQHPQSYSVPDPVPLFVLVAFFMPRAPTSVGSTLNKVDAGAGEQYTMLLKSPYVTIFLTRLCILSSRNRYCIDIWGVWGRRQEKLFL